MEIKDDEFINVIKLTPLVSIDLLIKNADGKYLLGLRENEPAGNYWFVPGGRIKKDERISDAFKRITLDELHQEANIEKARFLGVFEHIYKTNYACAAGFGTHYVV
ncbi:MAG: NUDIX domain-containing protein, partial [Planctomycetota bacterium]